MSDDEGNYDDAGDDYAPAGVGDDELEFDDADGGDDEFDFDDDDKGLNGEHWADEDDQFQDNNYEDDIYELNEYLEEEYGQDDDNDGNYVPGHDSTSTGSVSGATASALVSDKGGSVSRLEGTRMGTPPQIAAAANGDKEHPILLLFLLVGICLVLTLQHIVKRSSPSATYKRDDGDSVALVKTKALSNGATVVNGKRK